MKKEFKESGIRDATHDTRFACARTQQRQPKHSSLRIHTRAEAHEAEDPDEAHVKRGAEVESFTEVHRGWLQLVCRPAVVCA